MVVFAPFKKSKTCIVPGTSRQGSIISEKAIATSQSYKHPILRNFSYPTSVGSSTQLPSYPAASRARQTTWDHFGELYSFSPDRVSKTQTTGVQQPFFYKRDPELYIALTDDDSASSTNTQLDQVSAPEPPKGVEPQPKKKQRRSALLSMSISYAQDRPSTPWDSGVSNHSNKSHKASKSLSFGNYIFPQRNSVRAGFELNSLDRNKGLSHSDRSRDADVWCTSPSPERPVSSSGVPMVDTRLKYSDSTSKPKLQSTIHRRNNTQVSFKDDADALVQFNLLSGYQPSKTDHYHRGTASRGGFKSSTASTPSHSGEYDNAVNTSKHSAKNGKSSWLSQLKGWISVSEPSYRALKQHKKDGYKRSTIPFDDPRANIKLSLPIDTLPPEAIKPPGWGTDPEEVIMNTSEQRKKLRQSYNGSMGTSEGSRSSSSQHSSFGSVATSSIKEDTEY